MVLEEFEDTKGVIRIRKSKKDRQSNDQKEKEQKDKKDLQNTTQKTKDWATRTSLKTVGELRCSGRLSSSCSISGTCRCNFEEDCLKVNQLFVTFSSIIKMNYITFLKEHRNRKLRTLWNFLYIIYYQFFSLSIKTH